MTDLNAQRLVLDVPGEVDELLRALMRTGLFGETRADVAERLLYRQLEQIIGDGWFVQYGRTFGLVADEEGADPPAPPEPALDVDAPNAEELVRRDLEAAGATSAFLDFPCDRCGAAPGELHRAHCPVLAERAAALEGLALVSERPLGDRR